MSTRPKSLCAVAMVVMSFAFSSNANAQCQVDQRLTSLRDAVIAERFPELADPPPPILLCGRQVFPAGAQGQANGNTIRVLDWVFYQGSNARSIVGHELAHVSVYRSGCRDEYNDSTSGHGSCFLRELIRSGMVSEAQRVAQQYSGTGGQQALADARRQLGQIASAPPQQPDGQYAPPPIYAVPPIYTTSQNCFTRREYVGDRCHHGYCQPRFRDVTFCTN